jgi:hypothetical protein
MYAHRRRDERSPSSAPDTRRSYDVAVTARRRNKDPHGKKEPWNMPSWLFPGMKDQDYSSAVKADTYRQKYTVCPRYWYFDAWFECIDCEERFLFSADEQQVWYEKYQLWIDATPIRCKTCRGKRKEAANALNSHRMLLGRSPEDSKWQARMEELEAEIRRIYGFMPAYVRSYAGARALRTAEEAGEESGFTPFERAAMEFLLAGKGQLLSSLRRQLAGCWVAEREVTESGFFTTLAFPGGVELASLDPGHAAIGDVQATVEGMDHPCGVILHLKDALIDCLEGYSEAGEPWPDPVGEFELRYYDYGGGETAPRFERP